MEQFTLEELAAINALCEGRLHTVTFIKAMVPGMGVMGDIGTTAALAQKVSRMAVEIQAEEKKKAAEAEKK